MPDVCCICVMCRQDLFARYNLSVPRTWDEFLLIAKRMNGTDTDGDGTPDLFGTCVDVATDCKCVPACRRHGRNTSRCTRAVRDVKHIELACMLRVYAVCCHLCVMQTARAPSLPWP